ncbi:MAG: hypothetical protein D6694_07575 [Gammaproteobacteria bacterium]|nr:MAG: hypothetical protein D6694_07575 [Gammaproteobacteria bacterium]
MARKLFDILTYCADTTALMAEVAKVDPDRLIVDEQTGQPIGIEIDKTPTVRNGAETLAIVRVDEPTLAKIKALTTIKVLSEVPAGGDLLAAMSKANRALYDKVHDRTPQDILDEQGNVIGQYVPPELIGGFM